MSEKRRQLRLQAYERDRGLCAYCGTFLMPTQATLDHIVARSKGGRDVLSNTVIACKPCNAAKGASDFSVFKVLLKRGNREASR